MLIEFKFKNFGPFRDEVLLSMVASNYDKTEFERENVVQIPKFDLRLLKSAAIYGSNASGKTQLFNSFDFMTRFVLNGGRGRNMLLFVPRFRLDDVSESNPTAFTVVFLQNDKIFEYGFELGKERVEKEWLFVWVSNRRSIIFHRTADGLNKPVSKYFKVGNTIDKARQVKEWNLYLTKAFEYEQAGNEMVLEVKNWFEKTGTIMGNDPACNESFTYESLNNSIVREKLVEFIRTADLSLDDVVVERNILEPDVANPENLEIQRAVTKALELLPESTSNVVKTRHKRFLRDGSYDFVEFNRSEVSEGTLKFIAIAGPIIETLTNGGLLVVDEFDTKLHPRLFERIIELFHSIESNPNNAQLIFNSHNTSSMTRMRRDQIWFTEKTSYGVSSLSPLSDYKYLPRKGENLEERYLDGRFGAVPFLGQFGFTTRKHPTGNSQPKSV